MSFDAASPNRILREVFGYPQFRAPQGEIIDHVARGGDALVLMPTGGGKSLCYQIPALVRPGIAVVVSPLIALMQDQVAALKEAGVRAETLNSSLDWEQAQRIERLVRAGGARPAVPGARAAAYGAVPGTARRGFLEPVRDRRGALRLAVGP